MLTCSPAPFRAHKPVSIKYPRNMFLGYRLFIFLPGGNIYIFCWV